MENEEDLRQQAIRRLRAKQSFRTHLSIYAVINLMFVAIWFFGSRGPYGHGYFWPIWPMLGWGIGLFFHWFGVYRQMGLSEAKIQAEIDRLRGGTS